MARPPWLTGREKTARRISEMASPCSRPSKAGLEQVWTTGCGALEMDPSLLNTKHTGGVCGVWLGASDVSEAADLIHPAFNTLRCVCFDELLTPDCSTQVSVALTGDLDASVLK